MKIGLRYFLACILTLVLAACSSTDDKNALRVGVVAGPESELMEVAKTVARDQFQTNIKIVQFTDYIMPNVALNDKSIDVNVYQHEPYLQTAIKLKGYRFKAVGKTFIYPMAIYSKKLKKLDAVARNAVIAIPNDPSNGARALLLLNKAGLLKLKPNVGANAMVSDIAFNPMHFVIKELDAAQLPRTLDDVDLAVINTNYALPAGLLPKRDGLFIESSKSPYANIVVARDDNANDPRVEVLLKALHSAAVQDKAKQLFQDQAIAAW